MASVDPGYCWLPNHPRRLWRGAAPGSRAARVHAGTGGGHPSVADYDRWREPAVRTAHGPPESSIMLGYTARHRACGKGARPIPYPREYGQPPRIAPRAWQRRSESLRNLLGIAPLSRRWATAAQGGSSGNDAPRPCRRRGVGGGMVGDPSGCGLWSRGNHRRRRPPRPTTRRPHDTASLRGADRRPLLVARSALPAVGGSAAFRGARRWAARGRGALPRCRAPAATIPRNAYRLSDNGALGDSPSGTLLVAMGGRGDTDSHAPADMGATFAERTAQDGPRSRPSAR